MQLPCGDLPGVIPLHRVLVVHVGANQLDGSVVGVHPIRSNVEVPAAVCEAAGGPQDVPTLHFLIRVLQN